MYSFREDLVMVLDPLGNTAFHLSNALSNTETAQIPHSDEFFFAWSILKITFRHLRFETD